MSATELIEPLAALSQRERTLFEQLFHAMNNHNHASDPVSHPNWGASSSRDGGFVRHLDGI